MSHIIHTKHISYVKGDVKVDIDLSKYGERVEAAQYWLDSQIMNDMEPYMPFAEGNFVALTRTESAALAGSGEVVAGISPMGRYLYFGKIVRGPRAGEPLNFSKLSHPNVTAEWFEAAKAQHIKEWVAGVQRIMEGGDT